MTISHDLHHTYTVHTNFSSTAKNLTGSRSEYVNGPYGDPWIQTRGY